MAQLSALPPPPLRPVSPLWTFRGLKRPQHVSAVQGRDVPATKLFAASVKNFCVCPRTTAPCRGCRCPIGKVHCGEKPRRSGRQKGLSPLRGSNRSARRPDSAEGAHPPVSAEPAGAVSGCRYGPMSEKPGLQRPFRSRRPCRAGNGAPCTPDGV
ncbi:Uncharacterised protein [Shigella sonnei]|nr:Uncharacterised protein [Shigella sonnei]